MKRQNAASGENIPFLGRRRVFVLLWALIPILLTGCATKRVTTGAFTQLARIEEFKRGVSTEADVRRVLGPPRGGGSAIFPPDRRQRQVWFYEDIDVLNVTSPKPGFLRMDLRQQMLLVFFEEELFDGYMWFSNAANTNMEGM